MQTPKDNGDQGVAGPPVDLSQWQSDVHRVQTPDGSAVSHADVLHRPASDHASKSQGGAVGGTVQSVSGRDVDIGSFRAKEWVPKKYQERGVKWLMQTEAALFLPPGLGKTSITLEAIRLLKQLGLPHRTLLLAPLMVCRTTWKTEPAKWAQFQDLKIGFAHGPDKEKVIRDPQYDIVLMNYEGLEWAIPAFQKKPHHFDVLCCDEITRLKNTSSKRYKLLKPMLPSFKIRWGLTGTPAANGLMDLFGQVYVLDLGKRFGRYITHFRAHYFHQVPYDQYRYFITPVEAQKLVAKIEDLAMYVSPEEWLDLPEFLPIEMPVVLDKASRARYEELEDDFLTKTSGLTITAANAGVLTSKLRQVTGGAVYFAEKQWTAMGEDKLNRLDDLIEEMAGEPLMVAYQFDHERERILERHPKALALKGGMSSKAVEEVVTLWNSGEVPLLLVQPSSAALGLNLQFGGSAICWFTMTYNLEEYIQLNKRLHRQGQTKAVRCYLLAAEKTIDQRVAKVLARKDATQQNVFDALKLEV